MKVGWSCEVAANDWIKISLDEDDLTRLLVEGGVAADAQSRLPMAMVFALLDTECERLLVAKLVYRHGHSATERLADLTARRTKLLAQLAATYAAAGADQPVVKFAEAVPV